MPAPLNSQSMFSLWDRCSEYLNDELPPQQYSTWIKPLCVVQGDTETAHAPGSTLVLEAPNRFIKDWVTDKFQPRLEEFARMLSDGQISSVRLEVGQQSAPSFISNIQAHDHPSPMVSEARPFEQHGNRADINKPFMDAEPPSHVATIEEFGEELSLGAPKLSFKVGDEAYLNSAHTVAADSDPFVQDWSGKELQPEFHTEPPIAADRGNQAHYPNNILDRYRFDNFVEGKSNQLARAAAIQVVENPSGSYNPLFLYGGVGLGKTHLMHAVGNEIKRRNPAAKVVYLHAERFVGDMVKALQLNAINEFKRYYRSVDTLLIDDIQFFANKERSQEEFFHTFNALLEGGHQMIFSCDRYPKSIIGVEERLKSRFGWGLTVHIEAPELETRVAILKRKAEQENIQIPNDAAFFLANKVRANVRELEGALKRVNANAVFLKAPITIELIKESLKDLLALQEKMVSMDNIQRIVAEYFTIKVADLNSKRRNRSVARPRQMAMALAKELTSHSLPEIGNAFGGRDHTTVLHACRKIKELRDASSDISEDYHNLIRLLST